MVQTAEISDQNIHLLLKCNQSSGGGGHIGFIPAGEKQMDECQHTFPERKVTDSEERWSEFI